MAAELCRALNEHGISVPEDIAVVSNDDTPAARFTNPMLTTVVQPVEKIAERAIEVMMALIDGESAGSAEKIKASLVIRESA